MHLGVVTLIGLMLRFDLVKKPRRLDKRMKNLIEEVRRLSGITDGGVDKGSGWKLFGKIGNSLRATMDMFDKMNKDSSIASVTRGDFSKINPQSAKNIFKLGKEIDKHSRNLQRALASLDNEIKKLSKKK